MNQRKDRKQDHYVLGAWSPSLDICLNLLLWMQQILTIILVEPIVVDLLMGPKNRDIADGVCPTGEDGH